MKILSAEPTIFFIRDEGGDLLNLVRVKVENSTEHNYALLGADGGVEAVMELDIPTGESTHDMYVPDFRDPIKVRLRLTDCSGHVHDQQEFDFAPQRHWEVSVLQYSHHDLGYTDLPTNVLNEFDTFMDDVLSFCRQTEHWDDDSKFRYVCEQGWSIMHYLENASQEKVDEVAKYIQNGQIEITALFGNQTMEICGHEEQFRLMYPTFSLKRKYGAVIDTAMHNDVPGFSWGMVSAMASAGVKHIAMGIPRWYFGGWWAQHTSVHNLWDEEQVQDMAKPGGFWWEGPDGQRILGWYNFHGAELYYTTYDMAVEQVTKYLTDVDKAGYAYDEICLTARGGNRDNAPIIINYANVAREWNNRWAFPRLRNSTNSAFFNTFTARHGASLKTLRGDLPGTDYSVAASCTPRETAVDRNTHNELMTAEKLATMANLLRPDYEFPHEFIDEAYDLTFRYDLHCWGMAHIGGPAMDACVHEKTGFAVRASALTQDVAFKAAGKCCDAIAYDDPEGHYVTVFNSLSWASRDVIRVPAQHWAPCGQPMMWSTPGPGEHPNYNCSTSLGRGTHNGPAWLREKAFDLIDVETGKTVAYQLTEMTDPQAPYPSAPERTANQNHSTMINLDIVFVDELPAMGYKTYKLVPREEKPTMATGKWANVVENDFYKLTIDREAGKLTSIVDKELGTELLDGEAGHAFGQIIVRKSVDLVEADETVVSAEVVHAGEMFTTIRFKGTLFTVPQWTKDVVVYHGIKRIDLNVRLLKDTTPLVETYVAFPFKVADPQFRFEASNSVMEPTVDQLPGTCTDYYATQHWADVSNGEGGITWAPIDTNMAEYGGLYDGYVSAAHHGATGPGYGHEFLKPHSITKGHMYSMVAYNNYTTNFANVHAGDVLVRYAIRSHEGCWREGQATKFGWQAAHPPLATWMVGQQAGPLAMTGSFCQIDADNVCLTTIKPAEDGDGLILRLIETQGESASPTVTLPNVRILSAALTNAVEESPQPVEAKGDNSVKVSLRPYGNATIRIRV